ncbi:MAG: Hsp20/alpha crystallin family protein [Syntrophales bacterium]|jgi:HSP20 family protein|nr:Hsp20/alpha crystallin family protein [Syntrophales bacterium]MDY0044806.1 Hsp20/alpha crystallin family protein [Syntrophales bacterium]
MTIRDLVAGKKKTGVPERREDEFPFFSLQKRMNELFDSFLNDFGRSPFDEVWRENFSPKIDVIDNDKVLEISAELPGMEDKDISVSLTKDALILKGEKKEEKEEKGKDYWHSERRYGSFHRVIPMPEIIDTEKVEATFKKGVLQIRIPKMEGAVETSKKIPIKTE